MSSEVRAGGNTGKMAALMRVLKRNMNGAVTESMERRGIHYPCNWGVSLHAVRTAAQGFAPDHEFAKFLYGQQIRELRLAAYVIADPMAVTAEELAFWGAGVTNAELAENLAFSLLSRSSVGDDIVDAWLDDKAPVLLQYCALLTVARMVVLGNARKDKFVDIASEFVRSEDALVRNAAENLMFRLEIEA